MSFRGNSLLKSHSEEIEWTPELIQEYVRCAEDPEYFINTYCKIVHVDKGLIPFQLYDYQKRIIESVMTKRNTIVLTPRQVGKSTVIIGTCLHHLLFRSHYTIAILANKASTARELLSRLQLAFQHLPKWLQQGVIEWNKGSIELENGSKIIADATSSDAIRGKAINFLFIDEAAFIDIWDQFFTSVFPTITSGNTTKIVLVSTPNGQNYYYDIWEGAVKGLNNYNPIKVEWWEVPGRDEAWMESTLKSLNYNQDKFDQEFCAVFIGSSNTLISGGALKMLEAKIPISNNDNLKIYEQPKKGHVYVMAPDVSRGKLLDYSAFSVIDVTEMPYRQVATYRSNEISPAEYARVIHQTAIKFNDAYVMVEINDIGQEVSNLLHTDFEYEYLIFTGNNGRGGKKAVTGFGGTNVDNGIRTTKTVKNIGCSTLKLLVEQRQLIINDTATINELSTFISKGVSFEAEPGKHDDTVMSLVLFAWLTTQDLFKNFNDINTIAKLRELSEEQMEEHLMPLGMVDSENFGSDYTEIEYASDGTVKDIWLMS